MNPYVLTLACTLGASSAYMMSVSTPPNAIVFRTGLVRLPQMMQAGFWLNLASTLLITALVTLGLTPWLGHEEWQRSQGNAGSFRSAQQGPAAMQRLGGRGPANGPAGPRLCHDLSWYDDREDSLRG
jgi:hypothetical protein